MRSTRGVGLGWAVFASAWTALGAGCVRYQVKQSSLVPAMALPPPPTNRGSMDLYLGDSTVTFLSEPERAPSSTAGLWVARHNLELAGTIHAGDVFGLRILGLDALDGGAIRTAPTTVPPPGEVTWGGGIGAVLSLKIDERQLLHGELDLLGIFISSRVFATCVSSCEGVGRGEQVRDDRQLLLFPALSLSYAYALSPKLALTASLGIRDHATNREVIMSHTVSAQVSDGPLYATAGVGAEIDLASWISIVPRVQWPMMRDPIRYGPIVGLGLRGTLEQVGSSRRAEAHAP